MINKVRADGKLIFKQYSYLYILLMATTICTCFKALCATLAMVHSYLNCVVPENIHTCISHTKWILSKTCPTPLEVPIKVHTFLC